MTEPRRSRDHYHDATGWAHRYQRAALTTGEAEAAIAMRDRCIGVLWAMALRMRATARGDPTALACAATLDTACDLLRAQEPMPAETGLCGRGA